MTKEEAIKYLQQLYPNGGHCWLDEQRMEAVGMAIRALQEEPVKCMYTNEHYTDEDRKVLCEDCVERCEYSKKEEPVSEFLNTESMIESYKQRLISKANGMKKSPFIDMCLVSYKHGINETLNTLNLSNVERTVKNWKEEPVSEDLEEAAEHLSKIYAGEGSIDPKREGFAFYIGFKNGAKWQKENLWKPADGDDLPEIDREVVVLIKYNAQRNIHDEEYPTYRVGFGHRPNPDGWDGKDIDTNEVTHYTPKLYDKGGWNAPNIVYWLDARLPYEENKIIK